MAHNISIYNASSILYEHGVVHLEDPAEQAFIDSVLFRVGLTQLGNFPSFVGGIGYLVDNGPLQHPKEYPATWDDSATYPLWIKDNDWRELFED